MGKGLEALKTVGLVFDKHGCNYVNSCHKTEYSIIEKELMALDIIRRHMMVVSLVYTCKTAHEYSQKVSGYTIPTDREYNIVREVLCDE